MAGEVLKRGWQSIVDPLVVIVLRSPLHPLLSSWLLLLIVRGRRTGHQYTVPVQYARADQTLYVVPGDYTHKTWWRNLLASSPVRVRLQGHDMPGIGRVFLARDEPAVVAQAMPTYRGSRYPRVYGD